MSFYLPGVFTSCKFSKNGDFLASTTINPTSDKGSLQVLKILDNQEERNEVSLQSVIEIKKNYFINDCCWNVNGNVVIGGCDNGEIRVWSLTPSCSEYSLNSKHKCSITSVDSSNNVIISGGIDSIIRWTSIDDRPIKLCELEHPLIEVVSSRANPNLSSAVDQNYNLCLLDIRCSVIATKVHFDKITSCSWCPLDGNLIATGTPRGSLQFYDLRNLNASLAPEVVSHRQTVRRVKWLNHHRNLLLSAGFDGLTVITDIMNGIVLEKISHHAGAVMDVDCSFTNPCVIADCGIDSLLHVFKPKSLFNIKPSSALFVMPKL